MLEIPVILTPQNGDIDRLLNKFGHSDEEVNVLMQSALNDDDYDEYASFMANSEKVRMSMIATIKSALYIYSDEILKHISSQNSFNFNQLRRKGRYYISFRILIRYHISKGGGAYFSDNSLNI